MGFSVIVCWEVLDGLVAWVVCSFERFSVEAIDVFGGFGRGWELGFYCILLCGGGWILSARRKCHVIARDLGLE